MKVTAAERGGSNKRLSIARDLDSHGSESRACDQLGGS
jgi:hypothetical protein